MSVNKIFENPFEQVTQSDQKHVWHHLVQHKQFEENAPMMIVEGKGMKVWDAKGNEYLDAVSGSVWTVNVGYGRESIAKAVYDQMVKLCFFAGSAGNIPGAQFAEHLLDKMPGMGRVYYSSSGSEANEKAFKLVRQLSHLKYGGKKYKIIYRDRDYHGTTIATLSAGGQFERKNQYGPFVDGFVEFTNCCCYRCPFDKEYGSCNIECAHALEEKILEEGPDTVGALILEPITAGGGVIEPVAEYFPIIQEICKKYGVLLIIDEVVCGVGRTGTWFGYQHYDVKPDIVTMAKGVASGYAAISCTVTTEDLFEQFKTDSKDPMHYFRDISTYGGVTAGPAAALENMRIIEQENLLENVTLMGEYMMDQLNNLKDKHPIIGDVRGKGLFLGIELVEDRQSKAPVHEQVAIDVASDCLRQGVMIGRTNRSFTLYNNTLALSPSMICTKVEVDQIVTALDNAFANLKL